MPAAASQATEHVTGDRTIRGEKHQRSAAPRGLTDGHVRDADPGVAESGADDADHARTVVVADDEQVRGEGQLDGVIVDHDDPLGPLVRRQGPRRLRARRREASPGSRSPPAVVVDDSRTCSPRSSASCGAFT